jgi:hypothetical protein
VSITSKAAKKLRSIFLDTEVTIYLKDMNVVTVDEDQQEVKISAMAQGYVIDVDEEFFYLGLPDGTVTRILAHDLAQMVELMFEGSEYMDEDMPSPDEDVH